MTKPQITLKADNEILERFNELKKKLKDNGLTKHDQDALVILLDTFDDTKLAKTLDFGPTFKELGQIVARITEIFSNQAKQFETDRVTKEREQEARLEELQEKLDKAIEDSNFYKEDLKLKEGEVQELKEITAKHDQEKEDLEKRIEQQANAARSWETNFHKANDELEKVKAENLKLKSELEKVNELKANLSEMARHKEELERVSEEQKEKHKNEMKRAKEEHVRTLNEQVKEHQIEIGRIKNEQGEKHLNELKQAQQEREKQESKLNDKLSELQEKYQKIFENSKSLETEYEKLKVKYQQETETQSKMKAKPKDEHRKPASKGKKSDTTLS